MEKTMFRSREFTYMYMRRTLNFVGTEALLMDIIHFDFLIALTVDIIVFVEKMGCIQMCEIRQNYVILRREG
jgi:hypothetical protein